ncbi:MAG: hypothetical protein FWF91_03090 [Coriobacteriia bacterium]|nr:hypothetical protein [Coriobacteriia bacterium]
MEALNGTFLVKHNSPGGEQRLKITFKVDGNTFEGTCENMDVTYPLLNCKINGEFIEFAYVQETPMGPMKPSYRGTLDGDTFSGKVKLGGPYGFRKFEGERM